MTLELDDAAAPLVVAALVRQHCCPKCGTPTDDVPIDRRTGSPSWPCRPCRAAHQRARQRARRPSLCAARGCGALVSPPDRICPDHLPRFSR